MIGVCRLCSKLFETTTEDAYDPKCTCPDCYNKHRLCNLIQRLDEVLNPSWYKESTDERIAAWKRHQFRKKILDEIDRESGQLIPEWAVGGSLIYLSDGGYSRIFYSFEAEKMCVSSESTDRIHNMWEEDWTVKSLLRDINYLVQGELKRAGYTMNDC